MIGITTFLLLADDWILCQSWSLHCQSSRITSLRPYEQIQSIHHFYPYIFQGHLCDFNVTSGDGHLINCHSLILGTLSPFVQDLIHSTSSNNIILPDLTVHEVADFMTFLYTGQYGLKCHLFFLNITVLEPHLQPRKMPSLSLIFLRGYKQGFRS